MDDRSPFTVLITGAGTATCQSVIKGLRAQRQVALRIVTVDMTEANAGRWLSDHFETVPSASDARFLPSLLEICRRWQVGLLVPIVDYEFDAIARHRLLFEQLGCRVAISSPEVVELCNDKWKMHHFLKEIGASSPNTWLPGDSLGPVGHWVGTPAWPVEQRTVGTKMDAAEFPLFVKPRWMGRASIDTYRIDSPAQLAQHLQTMDQPLIQSFLTGREYTVDLLCDFHGKAINGVVRERIETKSGVSYKGTTVPPGTIFADAVRIAEALPIMGPVNLQCIVHQQTNYFIDINPRFSGALVLSIAAGFNSPLALVQLARGKQVDRKPGDYQVGVQMLRYWQEVFVHPQRQPAPGPADCPANWLPLTTADSV